MNRQTSHATDRPARSNVRILHVVGDSKFGGASLGILRLAHFWKSLAWDVAVLATDTQFLDAARTEGIETIKLDVIWREIRPLRDLLGLFRLYRYLRRNRYTVVHTHTSKAGFVGRIAARLAGVPVVLHTAHGFAFHEASQWYKIAFYSILERFASLFCDRVVTVSRFHEKWARSLGLCAGWKLRAIPNGIPEPEAVSPAEKERVREELDIGGDKVMLLTPGRLAAEKGLEDLIAAIGLLPIPWAERVVLVIAGDGPLRQPLADLVSAKDLGHQVRFLGFRPDISRLLMAADIVVLPTWREGLSIALLEAMAAASAIITTSISPNREATEDGTGAVLVPVRHPDRLGAAITRVASNAELKWTLQRAAREIFERCYTHKNMLNGYHRLYLELLKERECENAVSSVLSSSHR